MIQKIERPGEAGSLRTNVSRSAATSTVALCIGAGIASALLAWMVHKSLIDDAYITLSYARNLGLHFQWGLNQGATANTATSPLNVIVLGAGIFALRNAALAVAVVYVASTMAFAWWISRTVRSLHLPFTAAVLAVALVLVNPLMVSVVGMETTTLEVALIAALVFYAVEGKPIAFGVVAGLALLTRLDLVIFVIVLGCSSPLIRRRIRVAVLPMLLVSGPWFAFSWLWLGSAIPDTYVLKTLQTNLNGYTFGAGPLFYAKRVPFAVAVSFAAALAGAIVLVGWCVIRTARRRRSDRRFDAVAALGLCGVLHYAAYTTLGVPPYLWYYCPAIIALSISLALMLPHIIGSIDRSTGRAFSLVLILLVAAQSVVLASHDGMTWREPVIVGNVSPSGDYARIGRVLRSEVGRAVVAAPDEIGALAYFCECTIVDPFSDRGYVIPYIALKEHQTGAVGSLLLRMNYARLDRGELPRLPDYYLERQTGRGRDGRFNSYSSVSKDTHLVLRRSPVEPAVVTRLIREAQHAFPSKGAPVKIDAQSGITAQLYRFAIARALARKRIAVQLYTGGAGRPFVVATKADIDEVLKAPARVVAYDGPLSWRQRTQIKRRESTIRAKYRAGALSAFDTYVSIAGLEAKIGEDLALIEVGR
jgi:hypothetical protein